MEKMNKEKLYDDYYNAISDEAYHRKQMEYAQEKIKACEKFLQIKKRPKK